MPQSEDLSSTSIAISLGILEKCAREFKRQGKALQIRALYVERDKTAFARLEQHLYDHTPNGIESKALRSDESYEA